MLFYIIILLEKNSDIEEAEDKLSKVSIREGEEQEKQVGGKFQPK